MESKEAIEVLTDKNTSIGTLKCDDTEWRKLKPAIDLAVEALEKQIPKKYKVIQPCKSVNYYQCPCCDGLLYIDEKFCGECGQAIDWPENPKE